MAKSANREAEFVFLLIRSRDGILNHLFVDYLSELRSLINSRRHTAAIVALVGYIVAGFLLEISHHDGTALSLLSQPVLAQHKCGAKELHIPIDKRHDCLACSHSAQRASVQTTQYVGVNIPLAHLATVFFLRERPLQIDILHSGKRGPPLHAA